MLNKLFIEYKTRKIIQETAKEKSKASCIHVSPGHGTKASKYIKFRAHLPPGKVFCTGVFLLWA